MKNIDLRCSVCVDAARGAQVRAVELILITSSYPPEGSVFQPILKSSPNDFNRIVNYTKMCSNALSVVDLDSTFIKEKLRNIV